MRSNRTFQALFARRSRTGSAAGAGRGWIVILIVGILGIATLILLQIYADREMHARDASQLEQNKLDVWHRLELGMEQRIHSVEALQGFMLATRKPPDFSEFDRFAATLMQTAPAAKGYAYGDAAGVIRHFYPLAGNEKALGLNIYERPGGAFLREAVRERRATVGDPVKVVQGGLSVIVRTPLFRGGRLVGHVQGVFDISKLVSEAADALGPDMLLQLEDAQGRIFYGATSPHAWREPVSVQVGDNHWRLRVAWRGLPPGPSLLTRLLIWLGGGLLLASLMYILYRIQSQARVLARAVDERTAALQESQRTLATLMNNLPGAAYRCRNDPDWTTEFVSEGISELTGYSPDDFAHGVVSFAQRIHPEDRDPVWQDVQAALAEKRPFQLHYRIVTADGRTRWVWEQGEGVFSPSGELLRLEGFVTDVTERRLAEDSLREREALLAAVMEALPIGVWITDRHGTLVQGNEAGKRIWAGVHYVGLDQYGVYKGWWADSGKPIAPEEWALARAVTKGETSINEVVDIECFDGTRKTILNSSVPLRGPDGAIAGAIVVNEDVTEQRRAQLALRQSEDRLRKIFEASNMVITVSRLDDGRFLDVNRAFLRISGWARAEVIGHTSFEINIWHDTRDRERVVEHLSREGAIHDMELSLRTKSGEVRHLLAGIEPIRVEEVDCLLIVGQDITERRKAETQMQKLSHALEQSADVVMITDRRGVIEYVNPTFEQVTGYAYAEVVGQQPSLLKSGRQGTGFYDNLWKTILAGEVFNDVFINRRKDGSLYYEEKTITPLTDAEGGVTHFIATGKDITERMQTQERLAYMAQHDPLTELPNRTLLLDRLKQSLAGARWRNRRTAVLFVDLDRFKTINDTLGHEVGDRLLQQLAGRFQASVREGDTVARFGGDEFVILLDDVASGDDVAGVAQKVLQALEPPFQVDRQTLYVTASIGVSLFPGDGEDAGTLLKNADIAMYRAKEMGKNTYQFYSADMSARAFERLTLESSLRRALEQGEFRLYYQPQVDVETGAIVGVEALLRWQHPEFGLVLPADFIPLLEETGLIVAAGEWVLQTACAQLLDWSAQGWRHLRMAVNLSPRQLQAPGLAGAVKRALDILDGEAGRLELEITEGVLVRHAPATVEMLESLHALGARMAIDDFGTGYSSLSYLRRLPIDTLKIDRAFVRDIPHDPDDSAITAAIIALAQTLKLEMIAEGVETIAQRDFLRAGGCRVMQGYLFSRPQPPADITRLLREQTPR